MSPIPPTSRKVPATCIIYQGFEKEGQDATFFLFREFLESIRVPEGREAQWRDFASCFGRMGQQFKTIDAHQAFEEIRGVIAASSDGVLEREAYREIGVRQSIFPVGERDWSKVKSLFWRDPDLAARHELKVLRANFRNSQEATRVANTLLKNKHKRFGSIDRESNFLVDAVAGDTGSVTVLNDRDAVKKELNQKTKGSTQFAVLVMRDEDKADARKFFQTPLIF